MLAAAQDDMDEYVPPFLLSGIKEKILATDLINQLDIADGLKELLLLFLGECKITDAVKL